MFVLTNVWSLVTLNATQIIENVTSMDGSQTQYMNSIDQ